MIACDALIVGGGPAGLAAAIVLARSGLRVTLCEGQPLPRDKACGEGIMPTGVQHLRDLGAFDLFDPAEYHRLDGVCIISAAGTMAAARFAEGPGLGVRRVNLSRALLTTLRRWPNAIVLQGTVKQIEENADGFRVGCGPETIAARLLVGADGLNSFVRRWAQLDAGKQELRRLGVRQHFAVKPWSNFVEVTQGHGIEAYVTPCGPEQVGLAFLWDPQTCRYAAGGARLMPALLRLFPALEKRLGAAPPCSAPRSSGPLNRATVGRTRAGLVLIGDAGGYLDACTGEGISLALAQALILERTVAPLLRRQTGKLSKHQLAAYDQECRRVSRPYYFGARLQLYLCRHPRLADRLLRVLANDAETMSHLLSANMGTASFWPGWYSGGRFLYSLVRGR